MITYGKPWKAIWQTMVRLAHGPATKISMGLGFSWEGAEDIREGAPKIFSIEQRKICQFGECKMKHILGRAYENSL